MYPGRTNPSRWVTENPTSPNSPSNTPGQGMNVVHVSLIPAGTHRGEVLVMDGNLTNYGTRAHQPWAIVNPYWPGANPNPWPGQPTVQYRFHNSTLTMPIGQGELFCAGHCWMADGRLLVAGGTKRYPIQTGGGFEGARLLYQWEHTPSTGNPFGTWWRMADLEVERWYPSVVRDGSLDGAIVIGGTNRDAGGIMRAVNSYEVPRTVFNAGFPQLQPQPFDFDRKPVATLPAWPGSLPTASDRQYWGPLLPSSLAPAFDDYPRTHVLGVLDPRPVTGGTAPRIFVSSFHAWGIRWVHDKATDATFAGVLGGAGWDLGQNPAANDTRVEYATSLLLPAAIGGISSQVARVGGLRLPQTNDGSPLVETVQVSGGASSWQSGTGSIPAMNRGRYWGNVVILPTGELFAIGGGAFSIPGLYAQTPELLVNGTTWVDQAPHPGARDYHSTAILLPDARVFVAGGEHRKDSLSSPPGPGTDYAIWEPPYFHWDYGSVPPTGIHVFRLSNGLTLSQTLVGGMAFNTDYDASWTNSLEPGVEVGSVVLMRPASLTHHDDGGQRMVRLMMTQNPDNPSSVHFRSPTNNRVADTGWWMLFLVTTTGRPSQAYWVNLQ